MGITFLFSLYFVEGIEFECQSNAFYRGNIKEHYFLKRRSGEHNNKRQDIFNIFLPWLFSRYTLQYLTYM
jgi:hypothetical protein